MKHNPHSSSSSDAGAATDGSDPTAGQRVVSDLDQDVPLLASRARRLANIAVDGAVFSYALDEATELLSVSPEDGPNMLLLMGVLYVLTWAFPEAAFGRTLGKFVTGTRVVNLRGELPSLGQTCLRTLVRLVPLEGLSLLWGETIAWHDGWTKTRVVLVRDPHQADATLTMPSGQQPGQAAQMDFDEDEVPYPAGLGRRFGNLVIDTFVFFALVAGTVFTLSFQQLLTWASWGTLGVLLLYALVWTLPEMLFGRTLGKLITGTKVVNLRGELPSVGQACIRTIVRWVPFDTWSFLWGDNVGWHDSWANTRVVLARNPYEDIE